MCLFLKSQNFEGSESMKVNASFNDCKQTDIFQVGNVDDLVELRQYLIAGKTNTLSDSEWKNVTHAKQ